MWTAALLVLLSVAQTGYPNNSQASSPEQILLHRIANLEFVPDWKFLGVRTDNYGREYLVFFGANTIRKKGNYLDVVVANTDFQPGAMGTNRELFISNFQDGLYIPGSLNIDHVDCARERIVGFSYAKTFEDHLAQYVCAHPENAPPKSALEP